MNQFKSLIVFIIVTLFVGSAFAEEDNKSNEIPQAKLRDQSEFQKVIDEYKAYVLTITPETRDEIIAYRKEYARLNKEKKNLYKKLSQASQNYLKKEQQFKKRLPLNRKNLIAIEDPKNDKNNQTDSENEKNSEDKDK